MYVKIKSGSVAQYPYTIGNLRRDNPNTSFPKDIPTTILSEYGVEAVTYLEQPSYVERTHFCNQNAAPTLVDGTWTTGWTVSKKSADETAEYDAEAATSVRAERDRLLAASDWWASSDLTMSAEQTAYRKALRDLPTHSNWPNLEGSDWPTKP